MHGNPRPSDPRPSDIQWTRKLINTLRDGGIWQIPRCDSTWRLDKTNKVFTLVFGSPNAPDNRMLKAILPLIGYRYAIKLEPVKPVDIKETDSGTGKSVQRIRLPFTDL
jgi:hypothetical protein